MTTEDDIFIMLHTALDALIELTFRDVYSNELRSMRVTLSSEIARKKLGSIKQSSANEYIALYAVDREDWRSFKSNTIQQWRIVRPDGSENEKT